MSKEEGKRRGERLQLMLTNDEVEAVDTWRFEHRMPSRSAAVRALVRLGLDARVPPLDAHDVPLADVSSDDIGILSIDPRVEAVLGGDNNRPDVAVFASDPIVCHGLRDILREAGIGARTLPGRLDAVTRLVSDEGAKPVVLALEDHELGAAEVGEVVGRSDRLVVVCLGAVEADRLPPQLRGIQAISRLSAPEALVHAVRSLLADEEKARA